METMVLFWIIYPFRMRISHIKNGQRVFLESKWSSANQEDDVLIQGLQGFPENSNPKPGKSCEVIPSPVHKEPMPFP